MCVGLKVCGLCQFNQEERTGEMMVMVAGARWVVVLLSFRIVEPSCRSCDERIGSVAEVAVRSQLICGFHSQVQVSCGQTHEKMVLHVGGQFDARTWMDDVTKRMENSVEALG